MNANPSLEFLRRAASRALVGCLAGSPILSIAQTAVQPPVASKETESTLVLSPFEVTAEKDNSYAATHTLAGTRFNTALKDVPASVSVLTADFIRDIGAMNLNEALVYTIGAEQNQDSVTGNDRQGSDVQLRMRGFLNSTVGRNYFEVNTAQDSYNMERATFSRGPNSVLYGTGGAGGIADAATKRAEHRDITAFVNRIGLYDDYRFEFDVNRPITDTLAVRLNLLNWSKKSWRDFEFMDRRSGALAATWKPFSGTTVRIDAEYGEVDELKAQGWSGFDGVTQWVAAGRPISTFANPSATTPILPGSGRRNVTNRHYVSNSNRIMNTVGMLRSLGAPGASLSALSQGVTTFENEAILPFSSNLMGPGATTDNDFRATGIFLEQRIGRDLFVELAANQQHVDRVWARAMIWNDATLWADINTFLPGGAPNPYVGQYYVESNRSVRDTIDQTWNDYRATAAYNFSLPRVGTHQLAALVSRRDSYNWNWSQAEAWINNPSSADYTNAANAIYRRTYLSFSEDNSLRLPRGYDNPFVAPINTDGVSSGYYISSRNNNLSRFDSMVAVLQSRFFSDRLVTTVGVRRDKLRQFGSTITRDAVTREITRSDRNSTPGYVQGDTRTLGLMYHVLPQFSLAVNTSNNASPQGGVAFGPDADNLNIPLGVREGEGFDVGVRVSLLDGRVRGAITYFETSEVNSQRAKFGNATSGWLQWLNRGHIALGKPNASVTPNYISGEDTVDLDAKGWETEWTLNLGRGLRVVANGSKSKMLETNRFPRIFPFAAAMITELRANPTLPVASITGIETALALADRMQQQIDIDRQTENKDVLNTRELSGNVFLNYRFLEGRLQGLAFSVGANLRGPRVIG